MKADIRKSFLRWIAVGVMGVAAFLLIHRDAITKVPALFCDYLRDGFSCLAIIILMIQLLRFLFRKGGLNAGKYMLYLLGYIFNWKKGRLHDYFDEEVDTRQSKHALFPGFTVAGVWFAIGLLLTIIAQ